MRRLTWAAIASFAAHGGLFALPTGSSFKQPELPMTAGIAVSLCATKPTQPPPPAAAAKDSVPFTPPAPSTIEAKAPPSLTPSESPAIEAKASVQAQKISPVKKTKKTPPAKSTSRIAQDIPTGKMPQAISTTKRTLQAEKVPQSPVHSLSRPGSPKKIEATPRYEHNKPPLYPRLARKRGLEGTVLLDVRVSSSGKVDSVRLGQSSGFSLLDKSAIKAVKKWLFHPAKIHGDPVAMNVRIPVRFDLTEVMR